MFSGLMSRCTTAVLMRILKGLGGLAGDPKRLLDR